MEAITVSKAKASLGRLMDRTLRTGKPVYVQRKGRFVQIAPYQPIEPLFMHRPGALPPGEFEIYLSEKVGTDAPPAP